MVTVETIGRIRRAFWVDKKPIRQIVRKLRLCGQTVRKAIRGSSTEFRYERQGSAAAAARGHVARTRRRCWKAKQQASGARERLTARCACSSCCEAEGYEGAYDSVQRHVREWRRQCVAGWPGYSSRCGYAGRGLSVRLVARGGGARRGDHDGQGRAAHIRLCRSRMFLVRAYPRETQEMVFDAARARASACSAGCAGAASTTTWRRRSKPCSSARSALQPPLSGDVLALPGRADRLHPGGGLGRRGRSRTRSAMRASTCSRRWLRFAGYADAQRLAGGALPRPGGAFRARIPSEPTRTVWEVLQAEQARSNPLLLAPVRRLPRNRGRGVEA